MCAGTNFGFGANFGAVLDFAQRITALERIPELVRISVIVTENRSRLTSCELARSSASELISALD